MLRLRVNFMLIKYFLLILGKYFLRKIADYCNSMHSFLTSIINEKENTVHQRNLALEF